MHCCVKCLGDVNTLPQITCKKKKHQWKADRQCAPITNIYWTKWKESLFYLTMPLKHIDFHIIGYWMSSIWSLWHSSVEGTHCCHIGYSFPKTARDLSYALSHSRTAYTTSFDRPVEDHWLEWKIVQTTNASSMQDRSTTQEHPNLYSWVLYHLSYVPPFNRDETAKCLSLVWYSSSMAK